MTWFLGTPRVSVCCSYCGRSLTFSTASQMVTAKAPSLTPVFICSLLKFKRSCCGWRQFLPTFPSRPQLRLCVAPRKQSACVYDLCLGRLWKGFSMRKTRAVLGVTNACHRFRILNLHWTLSTLSAVVHRTETSLWGLVSAASWYTAEFWSTTPVVLCVVGTTSTSVSARSTPQDVPLRLRLAPRSPLTCRQQANLAEIPPPLLSARRS